MKPNWTQRQIICIKKQSTFNFSPRISEYHFLGNNILHILTTWTKIKVINLKGNKNYERTNYGNSCSR